LDIYLMLYGKFQGFYYSNALNNAGFKVGMAHDDQSHKMNHLLKLKTGYIVQFLSR